MKRAVVVQIPTCRKRYMYNRFNRNRRGRSSYLSCSKHRPYEITRENMKTTHTSSNTVTAAKTTACRTGLAVAISSSKKPPRHPFHSVRCFAPQQYIAQTSTPDICPPRRPSEIQVVLSFPHTRAGRAVTPSQVIPEYAVRGVHHRRSPISSDPQ
jgi:hypothetical protein